MKIVQCGGIVAKVAVDASSVVEGFGIDGVVALGGIVFYHTENQTVRFVGDIRLVTGLDGQKVVEMAVGIGERTRVDAVKCGQSFVWRHSNLGGDAHQAAVRCAAGATCQEEENSKVIEYVLRLNKSLEHSSSHNQMEKIEERNQKQKIYNRHDTTVARCVGMATRLPGEL